MKLGVAAAGAAGAGAVLAGCEKPSDSTNPSTTGSPKPGGKLIVGIGGVAEAGLDPHTVTSHPDEARARQLYDTLYEYDSEFRPQPALAESLTPNSDGTVWTVKLRSGIKFADGRPVTAADVIATLKRIRTVKAALKSDLADIDLDKSKAVDERTAEIVFSKPNALFVEIMAEYKGGIVPADFDVKNPIGAGPFKYKSYDPATGRSVFVRNPHYWRPNEPLVDEIEIREYKDETARVNALLDGQVHAIDQLPAAQVQAVKAKSGFSVLVSETGSYNPITMRVDVAPFDDVRVRQALRLVMNRQEIVDQAYSGYATVAHDLYGRYDPATPADLKRNPAGDIAKAKELLQQANKTDLKVELVIAPVATGVVKTCELFAEQAKKAGITINIKKLDEGEFWKGYLAHNFAVTYWYSRGVGPVIGQCAVDEDSAYNETHFGYKKSRTPSKEEQDFRKTYEEARRTVDQTKRNQLLAETQKIMFNAGGYIIPCFVQTIDAHSNKLAGFTPDKTGLALSGYGFRKIGFTS